MLFQHGLGILNAIPTWANCHILLSLSDLRFLKTFRHSKKSRDSDGRSRKLEKQGWTPVEPQPQGQQFERV